MLARLRERAPGRREAPPEGAGADRPLPHQHRPLTQPYHQEPSHFHYPGLPPARVPRPRAASPGWPSSRRRRRRSAPSSTALIASEGAELVPYIQYPDDVPLRQWEALNRSRDWTAIHLVQNGARVEANARHCPRTMAAARAAAAAGSARRLAQRDVLAARAGRAHPAAYRRRQHPPGLPPAADRAAGLLVPGRRRDPRLGAGQGLGVRRHDRA